MQQSTFVLRLERFVGARVDLGEKIALLDILAFLERDFLQISSNLRRHGDCVDRRHRAQGVEDDTYIAAGGGGDADRLDGVGRIDTMAFFLRSRRWCRLSVIKADAGCDDKKPCEQPPCAPVGLRLGIGRRLRLRLRRSLRPHAAVQDGLGHFVGSLVHFSHSIASVSPDFRIRQALRVRAPVRAAVSKSAASTDLRGPAAATCPSRRRVPR